MSVYNLLVRIGADVSGLLAGVEKSSKSLKAMGERMDKIGKDMSMKLTAPIAALGTVAAKSAIDFESAFAGVRKTVDATEAQYAELEKGIRSMAKTIPASATAIASVAEAAGQLGIERENILAFSRVMIDLGESTNLSADQAATSLARLANITQMPQTEFSRLGSTVVALGNSLATTEAEIVEMGLRLAGAGKQVGMSEAQILGFAGALSSVGIAAEAGGTAFSRVFKDIYTATATSNKHLATFAQVAGMSAQEFKQAFQADAAGAIISFVEGLGKIGEQGGNTIAILDKLGLSDIRVSDSLLRASGAGDLFRKSIETGTQAWQENTALTKEAEERYKTLASVLERTKNYLAEMAITFGRDMMPMIKGVAGIVRDLAEGFASLDPKVRGVILVVAGLAAAIGPLLVVIGSIATAVAPGGIMAVGFAALANPIGLTIAAIAALTVAAVTLWANWEPIAGYFQGLWDRIIASTARFYNGFAERLEGLSNDVIGKFVAFLREKFGWIERFLPESMRGALKGVSEAAVKLPRMVVPAVRETAKTVATEVKALNTSLSKAGGTGGGIIDVDAILAGAEDAGKGVKEKLVKPVEESIKAVELSFQGLYARFRQIDTEAKYLGTGSIDVLRQKIQALEGQIKDSLAFTGPMTGDQRAAFDQAVKSLEEYRNRLKDAEEAQRELAKSAKGQKSALQTLKASVSDVLSSVNGLRDGFKSMAETFGLNAENAILGAAGAMGNFAMAGVQVWTSVSTLIPQLYSMGVAMHASLGPIGLITGAIALLAAGIGFLIKRQDEEVEKSRKAAEETHKAWKESVKKISDSFQSGFASSVGDTLKRYFSGDKINWLSDLSNGVREAVIDGMIQALVQSSIIEGKMGALMKQLSEAVASGNTALVNDTIASIKDQLPEIVSYIEDAAGKLKGVVDFQLPDPGSKSAPQTPDLGALPGSIAASWNASQILDEAKGAASWANREWGLGWAVTGLDDQRRVLEQIQEYGRQAVQVGDNETAEMLREIVHSFRFLGEEAVPQFASGGIVTGPTLGMIGEAGDDEAILPLNDATFQRLGSAIAEALLGMVGGKGGGDTYNVNIYPGIYVGDEAGKQQLARMFAIEINNLRMQAL